MLLALAKAVALLLLGPAASAEIMGLLRGMLSIWGTGCMNIDRPCCWFWIPMAWTPRFCADYKWKKYTT
jgi:hypothetical protein